MLQIYLITSSSYDHECQKWFSDEVEAYIIVFVCIHSYGCSQAHLDMSKVILNIESTICYEDWFECWCGFLHMDRLSTEIANFFRHLKYSKVWFLSCGPKNLWNNHIWFFNMNCLQNGFVFSLHFLYDNLVS